MALIPNLEDRGIDVVIETAYFRESDIEAIFGNESVSNPPVNIIAPNSMTMLDLVMELGVFKSRGEAKKNCPLVLKPIPNGYSEFKIGKLKKSLAIWNPTE